MHGFARHISAALVVVAMIAAQIMPAWAGCHSRYQQAVAAANLLDAELLYTMAISGHDAAMGVATAIVRPSDAGLGQSPEPKDICLGNCGCACGISGAFVLTGMMAIVAPLGVALEPAATLMVLPHGNRPDSPRRPPRSAA